MSERPLAAAVSGLGVVDPARAVVAATDEGFARGRAAFETLRVYGGRPFRLEEHLARLAGSAERLGLPEPDPEEPATDAPGRPQVRVVRPEDVDRLQEQVAAAQAATARTLQRSNLLTWAVTFEGIAIAILAVLLLFR